MKIVDESLASMYEPGMDADKLFEMYKAFGEDPFVRGPGERGGFYAWGYARERSAEICDERRGRIPTAEMKEAGSRVQSSAKVGSEAVRLKAIRLLGLLVGCWAMSVLVVTLGYLQWQDLEISWGLASRYLDVWPLAGGFGAMSLYAVALPAAVGFLSRKGAELTNRVSGTHAVLGWILLIWSYPGTEQLGRHSDPRAFLVLGLVWMVQLATSLMAVRILKPKRRTREIWT